MDLLIVALLSAFNGPVTALFSRASLRTGVRFALVKVLNTANMLPVAAYFFSKCLAIGRGFIPAFWPMKMLWLTASDEQVPVVRGGRFRGEPDDATAVGEAFESEAPTVSCAQREQAVHLHSGAPLKAGERGGRPCARG